MENENKPGWQSKIESVVSAPVALPSMNVSLADPLKLLQGKSSSEAALEAERAKLAMEMLQAKARAEQELAIAERIRTAVEVEIEDHYDASSYGQLGVDAESTSVGLRGGGQRVSRRVVRLKGFSSE
jgi:hypothetical protein